MKLVLKILGGALLLLVLATGVLAAANWPLVTQMARYSPMIPPLIFGGAQDRTKAQTQDIRYLRQLTRYDRSYSDDERAAFDAHIAAMSARAGIMSDAEFYLAVAQAAAITGNGHTNASRAPAYGDFNRIPAKLYWFSDGLYIVRAAGDAAEHVGARIVAIEGRAAEDVNAQLAKYMGGAAQWRRLNNVALMESPALMFAADLAAAPDALTLTLADADGAERDVTLGAYVDADADSQPRRRPWMTLRADALPDEDSGWRRTLALDGEAAPLYLRNTNNNFFTATFDGGVYFRPLLLLQRKETPIVEQFAEIIAGAPEGGYAFMIVDLRWSPGGDYTKVIDFVKAAPGAIREGGKLYVATSPQTFSAAIVMAAFLKFYGGEKSVIIGEPMGDDAQFWAETGLPFRLPNSGYGVSYATGYHDWEHGCAGKHEFCFSQNILHEVPAGSLLPTTPVSPTYADYASGRDVMMESILASVGGAE